MDKLKKFELMEKITNELTDLKHSQTAVIQKIGKIEVDNMELNDKKLIGRIADFCKENLVGGIVLGESKNFKGEDNPVMKDILKFKKRLEKATTLPVFLEPEFMSSSEAGKMRAEGDSAEMLDASAAAVILQSYMDKTKT